jgi:type IV secretory pathway VirB4 component
MPEITYPPNSTQQFVDVERIKNGIVELKNGSIRAVVMVGGLNFELKSEEEQDGIIGAYQNFLNSLDFSLQILIHSRKLNIDRYLEKMQGIQEREENDLLRNQVSEYIAFVRGFVKENEIMAKNFFVVVPYDGGGVAEIKKGISGILPFFGSKKDEAKEKQETLEQKVMQLRQRVDQVVSGLERIGLRAIPLNDDELTELYYNLYNPETVEKQLPKKEKEE